MVSFRECAAKLSNGHEVSLKGKQELNRRNDWLFRRIILSFVVVS